METNKTSNDKPDLSTLFLKTGAHGSSDEGMCLLEAVSWFNREEFSDHPKCVDIALAAFGRRFNDRLRDDERQLLVPLIPKLVGTRGSRNLTQRRAFLLVDRYLRTNLPAFLRELPNKPRPDIATRLEALDPIIDGKSAERARDLAREVRGEMRASYSAYDADAAAYDAYDADAAAYDAYAAAAYAYAYDAYDAAYDADAYAYAADAYDDAASKALRRRTIERSIAAFVEAIELTEEKAA